MQSHPKNPFYQGTSRLGWELTGIVRAPDVFCYRSRFGNLEVINVGIGRESVGLKTKLFLRSDHKPT